MTTPDEETDSPISFAVESETIRVRDELEGQRLEFCVDTPDELDVQPALTELFIFPVDNAISVTVSELHVSATTGTSVWNENGTHLGEMTTTSQSFPEATYYVQVFGSVNSYLRIPDAAFTAVYADRESQNSPLTLTFPEPTQVAIGARSFHRRPQATITVPDDPAALREALPYLASSIKEFSCERSWPTLRGHPPAIDRGADLEIPDALSNPETGVTIVTPETYEDLYRIAPLAFYLGADVEPESGTGSEPALHLENGHVEPLETPTHSLEEGVDELLRRCLVLDSLTRMEGYFSGSRYEYEDLAPHLPFYPPNLSDASIPDQLMEYLEVPFDVLEPYAPKWPMIAVFRPRADDAELLPHVLDSLSPVRVRDSPPDRERVTRGDRGSGTRRESDSDSSTPSPSPLRCYTDTNPPAGSGRLVLEPFEAGLTRRVPDTTDARLTYGTADGERADWLQTHIERLDSNAKLDSDAVRIVDVSTSDDLERVLEAEHDFLYCDLPVANGGFERTDGRVVPGDLDRVGAKTFVVHGEDSPEAALEFVRKGSIAGVALEEAVSPTHTIRLLEYLLRSQPLVESVRLAEIDEETAWRAVGDPIRPTVRRDGGSVPTRLDVVSVDEDSHELYLHYQQTDVHRLGSVAKFSNDYTSGEYQLTGLTAEQPGPVPTSELVALLEDTDHVVRLNGEVYHGGIDAETFVCESVRQTLSDVERSDRDVPRDERGPDE